jgi:hypothetical protein
MDGLTSGQHLDELADTPGAGLGLLGASDPVEDGVPVRAGERFEHRTRARIGTQGSDEILRHLNGGLPGIGSLPSTVLLRPPHLVVSGSTHPAGGDQPLCDGSVALRPRTSSSSRREAPSERSGVPTPQLTIDPTEADRLVKCLVVRDGRRIDRALLGQYQPDALGIGVMISQPPSPFAGVPNQELREIHGVAPYPPFASIRSGQATSANDQAQSSRTSVLQLRGTRRIRRTGRGGSLDRPDPRDEADAGDGPPRSMKGSSRDTLRTRVVSTLSHDPSHSVRRLPGTLRRIGGRGRDDVQPSGALCRRT